MNDNGSGTIDIEKLLEERGKIHGDAETTHSIALSLFNYLCHDTNKMKQGSKGMLFLICVKLSRGAQHPEHADHWDDIAGYAELIKRVECRPPSATGP